MRYNLEAMRSSATALEELIGEWKGQSDKLFTIHEEIDAMWDGDANDAFNSRFLDQDKPKYERLYNELSSYHDSLVTAINKYEEAESRIADIMK